MPRTLVSTYKYFIEFSIISVKYTMENVEASEDAD